MICLSETRRPLRVNFGRGGMKKDMEDAKGTHVDAPELPLVVTPTLEPSVLHTFDDA